MKGCHFDGAADGFTLIELMVVVAIIGLLGSIAIPNYERMTAKSRQGEARTALAAIYAVEMSFAGSEGSFTNCLKQAGFEVAGDKRYYFVGFHRPAGVPMTGLYMNCGPRGDDHCEAFGWNPVRYCDCPAAMVTANGNECQFVGTAGVGSPPVDFTNKDAVSPDVYLTAKNTFRAVAMGSISKTAGLYDIWSIDETKTILNESAGL